MTDTDRVGATLELRKVTAGYDAVTVLRGVDLCVRPGRALALLGPNGAGKTTLLRVAAGLLSSQRGRVELAGQDVTRLPPYRRTQQGMCLIVEGRGVFRELSVRDNLRLFLPPWIKDQSAIEVALDAFPVLRNRLGQLAGSMSGGEQQMLALSRAYLSRPQVVLVDEASMGLAPVLVDEIFASMAQLAERGVALVIVEQYVSRALELAQDVVVLNQGAVVFSGAAEQIDVESLVQSYLGVPASS